MNDLVRRWDTNQKALVLASLKGGLSPLSPFGKTEEGLVDLRGLQLEEPLLLNELSADGLDLSFSRIPKMLCVRSNFVNCSLRKAKVLLLSNGSIFENVDFSHAHLITIIYNYKFSLFLAAFVLYYFVYNIFCFLILFN